MLKFVFWALLAANAVLFAYGQGYLGPAGGSEHEPGRVDNQLAVERMEVLTLAEARQASAAVAPEPAPAPAQVSAPKVAPTPEAATAPLAPAPAPAPQLIACVQAGPFSNADARRFESRIARLKLDVQAARIDTPFQEITNHLVYLPANGGREGAQKRAAELKEQGVENFFIMPGDSPLKGAISLGVFKSDSAAQKLVADLQRQGVRGVRVLARGPQSTRPSFQYRRIDSATRTRIAGITDDFTDAELRSCQ